MRRKSSRSQPTASLRVTMDAECMPQTTRKARKIGTFGKLGDDRHPHSLTRPQVSVAAATHFLTGVSQFAPPPQSPRWMRILINRSPSRITTTRWLNRSAMYRIGTRIGQDPCKYKDVRFAMSEQCRRDHGRSAWNGVGRSQDKGRDVEYGGFIRVTQKRLDHLKDLAQMPA